MDIMELGAIGELVGGVAVIASLVFVGLQVRHSNKIASVETVRSFLSEYNAVMRAENEPELNSLIRDAMTDFDALSNDGKTRASHQLLTHLMLAQTAFMLHKRGLSDPDITNIAVGFNAVVINLEGLKTWWTRLKEGLDPEFVSFMEAERSKYPPLTELLPFYRPNSERV